jgi:hypothetical protein
MIRHSMIYSMIYSMMPADAKRPTVEHSMMSVKCLLDFTNAGARAFQVASELAMI